jgi:hypothetical protein
LTSVKGLCWWVDQDPTACPAPDTGFELTPVRTQAPVPGTNVVVGCVVDLSK